MTENPFRYGCVVRGAYFCPRPNLEKQLSQYIQAGQNLVFYGERRMGKTSLVWNCANKLNGWRLVYVDLYCIRSMGDFCRRVVKALADTQKEDSFAKKMIRALVHLRPTLGVDPNGNPVISIDSRIANDPDSVQACMELLKTLGQEGQTCIVFDEFQDVLHLPDGEQLLAQMRSVIQFQDTVPYLFLGSVRHDMVRIFSDPSSPFFKSALPMEVGTIEPEEMTRFIKRRFAAGNRVIDEETIGKILEETNLVTGDVQEFCDALWSSTKDGAVITEKSFSAALELIFSRELRGYEIHLSGLTSFQLTVLCELAKTAVKKPFSTEFMSAANFHNASSVRRAIKSLESKGMIYKYRSEYRFVNTFFKHWLNQSMG